jgi:hypothetical protein
MKYLNGLCALLIFAAIGCQSQTESLDPKPPETEEMQTTTDGVKIDINPMVDIVFVIDNSGSMRSHQARLASNIDRFVEAFGKKSIIDFHIGVLEIWDSVRYGQYDVDLNKVKRPGVVPEINRNGQRSFAQIGALLPLKAPVGQESLLKDQMKNYVIRGEGYVEVLRETLKIGVAEFERKSSPTKDASGPEYEELFTPVMAALRPPVSTTLNKGFFRPKAHLVVIMVTDANEPGLITANEMHRFLINQKGAGNFTVIGVINPSDQKLACERDPAGPPVRIEALINLTGGRILNLCSDYGSQLAEVGQLIQDRTIGEIRIKLDRLPILDSISVTYGSTEVPFSQNNGWTYDNESKYVIIRGAAKWAHQPGAKIALRYEAANPKLKSSRCIGCAQTTSM